METSCTWVASGEWFNQAVVLGTLIIGLSVLATSRGRQIVTELVKDDEAPEPQTSSANA